ncbi:MAG: efflux RND transporter periplasmic adaptor subunit [Bacteroides sp.]|nr:efflux RND transporter periplasmic adaptor subunit [Bacteroides sp.]
MDYPLEVVQPQNITLQSVYPAIIRGEEDIDIQPRIDGFIEAIYVDEGSMVKKGQVLFKINSPQSEQNLITAQASVTSAQASLNTALLDVERMRPLAEKNIISNVQLETYENAYASAQATLQQAEASVANASATLSWTQVTSPVDGIVGSIPYRQGSLVSSANTLTTVANTRNVFAYFSLNEKELLDILKERKNTASSGASAMPPVNLILADGSAYP